MQILKLLTVLFISNTILAQSPISEFSTVSNFDLAKEKVLKISGTKRILIITNSQDSYAKGDYITILVNKEPIARGVIPKQESSQAALKITKIYSDEKFSALFINQDIEVLRGDDSNYRNGSKQQEENEFKITDSDSLFDDTTLLEDDLYGEEKQTGIIKNDNVVSIGMGLVDGFNSAGKEDKNTQFNASWAFQVEKNIWIEGFIGRHLIKGFPSSDIDTSVNQYIFRAKYAFDGPLNTVFLPYAGYKFASANSPGAGDPALGAAQAQKEKDLVASVEKSEPVFGVTAFKRLVPGWFLRADLGTDLMGLGLALEF